MGLEKAVSCIATKNKNFSMKEDDSRRILRLATYYVDLFSRDLQGKDLLFEL